jgi:hypothetical protein
MSKLYHVLSKLTSPRSFQLYDSMCAVVKDIAMGDIPACIRLYYRDRSGRVARRLCRLSEALTPLPFMLVAPPENPTFSTKKKNTAGESQKMNQRAVFLVGRGRACPAQAAGLSFSHSAQNRFELRRTFAPKITIEFPLIVIAVERVGS